MNPKLKVDMVYIILHYNSIEDTRNCIESIRGLKTYDSTNICKYKIVIVDNASPNGTGKQLKDEYGDDQDIVIILNKENSGFSAGNNLGYHYVKKNMDPDFITICNNDIVFDDREYVVKVFEEYEKKSFYVLGPDIYNPCLEIHQSPLGESSPTIAAAKRTVFLNTIAEYTFPVFWPIFGKREVEKAKNRTDSVVDYDRPREDVPLMGACLVFSKDFMAVREDAFAPETFLYYEEFMLYNFCIRNAYAMTYVPSIHVLHYEGRATATASSDERDRYRRLVKNIRRAAKVYIQDML
ncbi:MAG: glycosyltransferase [Eubacterium sp.]|nr:glycosyltransferase [Eubacterium sp.]